MTGYDVSRFFHCFILDSVIHKLQRCARWSIASTELDFIFCPDMKIMKVMIEYQASLQEKVTFALREGIQKKSIFFRKKA